MREANIEVQRRFSQIGKHGEATAASRSPMTQVLTGHGVFGEYLKKIGRETTDICHHCGEDRDTAQHTLEACSAWELSRYTLRQVIGERLTSSAIIVAMLSGPQEYEAVCLFCERVMLAKERAEKILKKHQFCVPS
ncbi:uncharacterized protein LOC122571737 [Bombus pyrosoma]|uniref:uncharacterized protein LOC122571737 n=1 Tax=Bombus pyrosoma TaxID=396416 RepID=UPI001CB976E0|nr:uncharacterized protein LOC122571737 [Bombus pyrosoma]